MVSADMRPRMISVFGSPTGYSVASALITPLAHYQPFASVPAARISLWFGFFKSEQALYRLLRFFCKNQSSLMSLLLLFPKKAKPFREPYMMLCAIFILSDLLSFTAFHIYSGGNASVICSLPMPYTEQQTGRRISADRFVVFPDSVRAACQIRKTAFDMLLLYIIENG